MSVYYIDFQNGNDLNDGLTPEKARKSYTDLPLEAGDSVLFCRGSFIRDCLHTKKYVSYGAYGEGENPTFCGSIDASAREDWVKTEKINVWKYKELTIGHVGNIIFNENFCTAALRWSMDELAEQGDFFSIKSPEDEAARKWDAMAELYLYSVGNPAEVYSHIEIAPYGTRNLGELRDGTTFEDLRFINSGVHGLSGVASDVTARRCVFENIGGCPWNKELKIRFGNGFEVWHNGHNILVEECTFKNVYDSCVTYQGPGDKTVPTTHFNCRSCTFDTYGMAAFEYRDVLPIDSSFENNVCLNAGCGFAMLGEELPRYSEIWPEPMGHHIFLWRIPKASEGGSLKIVNNYFGPAPVGAAIYSIISKEAEAQITLDNNTYTENDTLLNHFGGKSYTDLEEYKSETGKDKNSTYSF